MVKDPKLRGMIADCLRYLPKGERKFYIRQSNEIEVYRWHDSVAMQELIDVYNHHYPLKDAFVSNIAETDYDGYNIEFITLNAFVKQSDEEFFNVLAESLCPTQYQIDEYNQYKRLKHKYEGVFL